MKKLFTFLIVFIGIIGMSFLHKVEASNNELDFQYKDTQYSLNFEQIANENEVDLADYPYRLIVGNSSSIEVYYSKERLKIGDEDSNNNKYKITLGANRLKITVKLDGTIKYLEQTIISPVTIKLDNFIESNQNIYYGSKLVFAKNGGYEYDKAKEKVERCNDIVKARNKIKVYESASVCYDEIATI